MAPEDTASRRPLSLVSRSTIATLLVLVGFLGVTGFALDRAYAQVRDPNAYRPDAFRDAMAGVAQAARSLRGE